MPLTEAKASLKRTAFLIVVSLLIGCGGGGGGSNDQNSNTAPVANAGPDQSVTTGTVVTLDGSDSSDANSDPLTYAWTFTSNPGGSSLSSATAVNPTFTPDVAGSYVLTLVVNDGQVDSAPDTVTITSGAAPEVTTGEASTGPTVTLNGNVTANGLPTEAWFEWGTDNTLASYTPTSHQSIDSQATSQPVSEALSGLTPETTYYYRIVARNDLGTTRGNIVLWVSF